MTSRANNSTDQNHKTAKELLALAAKPGERTQVVGRNREDDGVVPGWHTWAAKHAQRQDDITILRGRDEWRQRVRQNIHNNLNKKNNNKGDKIDYTVSIVSWNILSDTWWTLRDDEDYVDTPPEHGDWQFRFPRLLQWMKDLDPDVLAVQELDFVKFQTDLLPALRDCGYQGLMQNPPNMDANQPCANATFWKSDKFGLVQHHSRSRTLNIVLERNITATTSETGTNDSDKTSRRLCIANVHLESSQSDDGVKSRASQMDSALAYAAREAPEAALLVCGDFNTGADSELHGVLRDYEWHGHKFSSVYEHPNTHGTLPVCVATFMADGAHYVIDHMLYAQDSLHLQCALDAFSPQEMDEHVHESCGFPTAFCPSDHVPIGAILDVTTRDPEPTLCVERQAELMQQWEALQSQRPPHSKGIPSPKEVAARQKYKATLNAWRDALVENALEFEFATKLVKNSK